MKELIKYIESLNWGVTVETETDNKVELYLSKYSNAGEDFGFSVEGASPQEIAEELTIYANDFDTEEHIEMWLEAKQHGTMGVPTIKELVKDADEIEQMLIELSTNVREFVKGGMSNVIKLEYLDTNNIETFEELTKAITKNGVQMIELYIYFLVKDYDTFIELSNEDKVKVIKLTAEVYLEIDHNVDIADVSYELIEKIGEDKNYINRDFYEIVDDIELATR